MFLLIPFPNKTSGYILEFSLMEHKELQHNLSVSLFLSSSCIKQSSPWYESDTLFLAWELHSSGIMKICFWVEGPFCQQDERERGRGWMLYCYRMIYYYFKSSEERLNLVSLDLCLFILWFNRKVRWALLKCFVIYFSTECNEKHPISPTSLPVCTVKS